MDRGHGWDEGEDFYEEDEPVEKIMAAFEVGEKFVTTAPPVTLKTFGLTAGLPVTGSPHVRPTLEDVPAPVRPVVVSSAA
jgi:hypothetical protein